MKYTFRIDEVQKAVTNAPMAGRVGFVHDDGIYLLVDKTVIRPIAKRFHEHQGGDDFAEWFPTKDVRGFLNKIELQAARGGPTYTKFYINLTTWKIAFGVME